MQNCKTCENADSCTSCVAPNILYKGLCVKNFNDTPIIDNNTNCSKGCSACANNNLCTKCLAGYFLTQVSTCITNTSFTWLIQVAGVRSSSTSVNPHPNATCQINPGINSSYSPQFKLPGNASEIIVSSKSIMYINNVVIAVANSNQIYGTAQIQF